MTITLLDELAYKAEVAKSAEVEARQLRIEIENKIADFIETKREGSTTKKTSHYKITATGRINRKVDQTPQVLADLKAAIGPELFCKVFSTQYKLSERVFKELREYDLDSYHAIASVITETPAKLAVKIDRISEGIH